MCSFRKKISFSLSAIITYSAVASLSQAQLQVTDIVPNEASLVDMWWKDGFPTIATDAPWHRCIQGSDFGFVLDTEKLTVPHMGKLPLNADTTKLDALPPAELELSITANGTKYTCKNGSVYDRHSGPRLIESGYFFQRGDITGLEFFSDDGTQLYTEARLETAAWSDSLSLNFIARPSLKPIPTGESSFGKVNGGFGVNGSHILSISPKQHLSKFTVEFWVFIPKDYSSSAIASIFSKNKNELINGSYGINIDKKANLVGYINAGGGQNHCYKTNPTDKNRVKLDSWNHLALSYDGATLNLYLNGKQTGATSPKGNFSPAAGMLDFGAKHKAKKFYGAFDEIRIYDYALSQAHVQTIYNTPGQAASEQKPFDQYSFNKEGIASESQTLNQWDKTQLNIKLTNAKGTINAQSSAPIDGQAEGFQQASLVFNPATLQKVIHPDTLSITATDSSTEKQCPVNYNKELRCYQIQLDKVKLISPPESPSNNPVNDSINRIKLTIENTTDQEQLAPLMFEKTKGYSSTGITATLRLSNGIPTGIPVQLSKNWHTSPLKPIHSGIWFHGFSKLRIPPNSKLNLELVLSGAHWGGVAAASHAQLSLIGWGSNQLWEQSAMGSWGESICYEPDKAQAKSLITDVRPLMIKADSSSKSWEWTTNVGGGDAFRAFDTSNELIPSRAVKAQRHRQGPCLTEVTYTGNLDHKVDYSITSSISRSDDIVRGTYRLKMKVNETIDFSRFVFFQVGSDTYNYTLENKFAHGNSSGLIKEWNTSIGGNSYKTELVECVGETPWFSLHDAQLAEGHKFDTTANRGFIIRSWDAKLGGKKASPWFAERGTNIRERMFSTIDILPPSNTTQFIAGDYIEATIEYIVMPKAAKNYYGPNKALLNALKKAANTPHMILREAQQNSHKAKVTKGTQTLSFPDIRITCDQDEAALSFKGGLGYVPFTFEGLSTPLGHTLHVDGKPLDQSVHGNDFWQTDYNVETKTWSRTYNVPIKEGKVYELKLTHSL